MWSSYLLSISAYKEPTQQPQVIRVTSNIQPPTATASSQRQASITPTARNPSDKIVVQSRNPSIAPSEQQSTTTPHYQSAVPDVAPSTVVTGSAGLSAIVEGVVVGSSLEVTNSLVANDQHPVGVVKKSAKRKGKTNMPPETGEALPSTAPQAEPEPAKRAMRATRHSKHAEN